MSGDMFGGAPPEDHDDLIEIDSIELIEETDVDLVGDDEDGDDDLDGM